MADAPELSMEEAREQKALTALDILAEAPDDNVKAMVMDIRVHMRDRELHHFEVEQDHERLEAENERLKRELLATNNYAILRRGSGWDSEFDLIHWDEEDRTWTVAESSLSRGGATTLRNTYNARINGEALATP